MICLFVCLFVFVCQVQTLGRKTVQMLLQNNINSTLLAWVIDHCYDSKPICAQLCFHALCNTLASKYGP